MSTTTSILLLPPRSCTNRSVPPAITRDLSPLEANSDTASLKVFGASKSIHSNLPPPGGDYSITQVGLHTGSGPASATIAQPPAHSIILRDMMVVRRRVYGIDKPIYREVAQAVDKDYL